MTPHSYFEIAHWTALHVERHRPGWRGRWWLRRMLRRLRGEIPDIQMTFETVRRYR